MKRLGASLVFLGLLGLIFGGIPYNKKETVAQIGDFKMQATEKHELGLPPWGYGIMIVAGAALWFRAGGKQA
ncbi:MAG TPA: hypothetical protein VJY35_00595 [Candidatus Eisenbacteria bacterium]|nr:hypothetical protein [Candidatus Eisenbacteria bacterium]